MMAAARTNITDRAHRYRANKLAPAGPKVCAYCGSRSNVVPDHKNGVPDDTRRANLQWLCKSCNTKKGAAFAKAGKGRLTHQYNPTEGVVPTFRQYAWAVANHVRGANDEGGAIIHATPEKKRSEYAREIAGIKRERGTDSSIPEWARNPAKFDRCVKDVKRKGGAANAYAVCAKTRKKNPATQSAEAFEEFHGFPPTERVKVTQKVHRHRWVAAAGDLVGMQVAPLGGGPLRKIEGLGEALLTFNEKKNQLFITGGDQHLSWAELKKFGATEEHELQTVGKLVAVGYFTDKKHLGSEGGEAIYSHKFRTTNENGTHVTVTIAKYPDLIYRVLDEQFEISGGSYTILREGIDK